MFTMKAEQLPALFDAVAQVMEQKAEVLCEMDAKMGDGDLGLTMRRGFCAIPEFLRQTDEADAGKKLMKAGMKMAAIAPSTMGTLMASGIMAGGKALVGVEELTASTYLEFLRAFAAGVAKRGKCARGERTVLDSIAAGADALEEGLTKTPELSLGNAGELAVKGAMDGVEATKNMEPKYGKAAVFRTSAIGVADQGACAGLYMIEGFRDYFIK